MGLENFNTNQQETRSDEFLISIAESLIFDGLGKDRFDAKNELEMRKFSYIYDELMKKYNFQPELEEESPKMGM